MRRPASGRKSPTQRPGRPRLKRWEDQLAAAIREAEKASGKADREKVELAAWRQHKARGEC